MDIDTRTCELLDALGAEGTLTAAARQLHVSQPALSQRLSGLESRLGLSLFDRRGRRLIPTRAGKRMIDSAGKVLTELRAAERDLDDIRAGRSSALRFSSQCSTNYQWLPPVVHDFAEAWPDVDLRVGPIADDDVIAALLADRLDVALATKPDRRLDAVEVRPLFDDELVGILANDHPWAGRPHLTVDDFATTELVVFDSYDPDRSPALPLPLPPGARPARVVTTPVVSELLVELVVARRGLGVLPNWVAEPYVASGRVTTVALSDPGITRTWYAAWRRGPVEPHLAAFIEHLTTHFAT